MSQLTQQTEPSPVLSQTPDLVSTPPQTPQPNTEKSSPNDNNKTTNDDNKTTPRLDNKKKEQRQRTGPKQDGKNQNNNQTHDLIKISKFLALVLRHDPTAAGITLDEQGWASTSDLLASINKRYRFITNPFTLVHLEALVIGSDKQRFIFSDPEKEKIRANQGHSLKNVDLGLVPIDIPEDLVLFHGTAKNTLPLIKQSGLLKMSRQHVHLSKDQATALSVGKRHGDPIILTVDVKMIKADGLNIYLSHNGVHLMDHVPPCYLIGLDGRHLAEKKDSE
jgi:putative RNA 2'-phosphotransferase